MRVDRLADGIGVVGLSVSLDAERLHVDPASAGGSGRIAGGIGAGSAFSGSAE